MVFILSIKLSGGRISGPLKFHIHILDDLPWIFFLKKGWEYSKMFDSVGSREPGNWNKLDRGIV